jgi:glycyl-tRNA synthetase beta subunit
MTRALTKAGWLGSAGFTILVRCICGARLYVPRRQWAGRGFTVCDDCHAAIRYASLEVVDSQQVEDFVEMIIREGREREALKDDLERELRRFVRVYDQQPEWLWSPATVNFVRAVRPKLELLGGEVAPARGGDVASPEEAYRGE